MTSTSSRAATAGYLVADDGDAVAEQRNGQKETRSAEQAILPAANAVQQITVGVGDHVGVVVHVHLGGAENDDVHHGGIGALAVVVVAVEDGDIHVVGVVSHAAHGVEVEGLGVQHVVQRAVLQHVHGILCAAAHFKAAFQPFFLSIS
jgi:hypothetical protein